MNACRFSFSSSRIFPSCFLSLPNKRLQIRVLVLLFSCFSSPRKHSWKCNVHLNITKSQSFCAITIIAINKQDHYRKICISYEPPQSILHYVILAEVCHKMCRSVSQEQSAVSFSLNWTKTFRVSGNGRWWKNDRENCLHHVYPENVNYWVSHV